MGGVAMKCPGCHFGCSLNKYQCGRGKEFFDLVQDGGELPERRPPVFTPSEQAAKKGHTPPPINEKLVRGINIVSHMMRDRDMPTPEQAIIVGLINLKSFMSKSLLPKRLQLPQLEFEKGLQSAIEHGFVEIADVEHSGTVVRFTASGKVQAEKWKNERDKRIEEFFSALSDDEKVQLDSLLGTLLRAHMHRPR